MPRRRPARPSSEGIPLPETPTQPDTRLLTVLRTPEELEARQSAWRAFFHDLRLISREKALALYRRELEAGGA